MPRELKPSDGDSGAAPGSESLKHLGFAEDGAGFAYEVEQAVRWYVQSKVHPADVEDVMQEVLTGAWGWLLNFEYVVGDEIGNRNKFFAGLYRRILVRIVVRYRKRKYRQQGTTCEDLPEMPSTDRPTAEECLQNQEDKVCVENALKKLDDDERQIIELVAKTGVSVRQASVILKISSDTGYSRHHRAMEKLRLILGATGKSPDELKTAPRKTTSFTNLPQSLAARRLRQRQAK